VETNTTKVLCLDVGDRTLGIAISDSSHTIAQGEGEQAKKTREFARLLKEEVNIPIVFADERFTSLAAERFLREGGVNLRKRRKIKDKVAATILLQDYLDSLRREKNKQLEEDI